MTTDQSTLKLTRPFMHGPAVRRLQELGDEIGFDTGPNDGIFGPDTKRAVEEIQRKLVLPIDGICGPATWARLISHFGHAPDSVFFDIRDTHPPPKLFGYMRKWKDIDGVTIHQTGCKMPTNANGWRRLNAHFGITSEGKIVIVNDALMMIWHAQGLSRNTIGIEISGNYEGICGNPNTLWKGGGPACYLDKKMSVAIGSVLRYIKIDLDRENQKFLRVHAHRQSANSRIADPGSEIWRHARNWIKYIDGTDGGPDYQMGSGRPIPREWNSDYDSKYWG
jgi:hypothetical protein